MTVRRNFRLPPWTARPGFGLLVLLVLAVVLIAHGEPQPSSRPSGTSVGVSGTAAAPVALPALFYLREGHVELRQQRSVRPVALPIGAIPRAIVTGRGLSVVLAEYEDRQRAYAILKDLKVRDLGLADAVLPAVTGSAAVIIETAQQDPGMLPTSSPSASRTPGGSASSTPTKSDSGEPELRSFSIRRYDVSGNPIGAAQDLPPRTMAATDTAVGLVVWQPVSRVFDAGLEQESLSAAATLIRPDGTRRELGPVHPLAANNQNLLVWDVAVRRFGVMPLNYVTSTATSTATASTRSGEPADRPSGGESGKSAARPSDSDTASPRPTAVAGVRWFLPTRGMVLVTGPAAFNADGSAFAVYAQVGARRRLVVAELQNLGTDQVQVLALAAPPVKASATPSHSQSTVTAGSTVLTGSAHPSDNTGSGKSSEPADGANPSPTTPTLDSDGYPIPAPLAPLWWNKIVVGVGADGTVIGYQPGSVQSSLLDLGITDIRALGLAP